MSESRNSRLPRLTTTGDVADPKRMMRAIQQSTTRKAPEVSSLQTAEPTRQEPDKEDTMNKLADHVVSEERPASGGRAVKIKVSQTVKGANVRDSIADIGYLMENVLTTIMTPGPDHGDLHGDSRVAALMQAMIEKAVSAIFDLVHFEIGLRLKNDNIVS